MRSEFFAGFSPENHDAKVNMSESPVLIVLTTYRNFVIADLKYSSLLSFR